MLLESATTFLDIIFEELKDVGIFIINEEIDHLCYRTSSETNYQETKAFFEKNGTCLIESEINGRFISTYKLHSPIKFNNFVIPLVEVPAPKFNQTTKEGWEHRKSITQS